MKEFHKQKGNSLREIKLIQLNSLDLCTRYWLDCCKANFTLSFMPNAAPLSHTMLLPHQPPRESTLINRKINRKKLKQEGLVPCSYHVHIHPSHLNSTAQTAPGAWGRHLISFFSPISPVPPTGFWEWEKGGRFGGDTSWLEISTCAILLQLSGSSAPSSLHSHIISLTGSKSRADGWGLGFKKKILIAAFSYLRL